jgi:uncharacterized OB-fold protein
VSNKEIREDENGVLWSDYTLEYAYKRTVGPVIGRCLTDLRDGKLTGVKTADGRVLFPATEYDPLTGEDIEDFVEVGDAGEVTTWAWVPEPRDKHPLDEPFAWALIKLDGSDTPFLHVVKADNESSIETGMRVRAAWKQEREGSVLDIQYFEPEATDE